MRSDFDIRRDVEDELRSDPDIDATDIAVAVKDGVVTLAGFVRSFRQRRKAEQDIKRVAGVVGVVNNIEVRLPIIHRRPDLDRRQIYRIGSQLTQPRHQAAGLFQRPRDHDTRSKQR